MFVCGDTAESFGVKEDPLLVDVLGDGDCWVRVASTARAKPSAVVKTFALQWFTTDGALHTGTA